MKSGGWGVEGEEWMLKKKDGTTTHPKLGWGNSFFVIFFVPVFLL